jgi:predicted transcriptional regulator
VDKFKRTITLSKEGYDVNRIAFLLRLSSSLIELYVQLYNKLDLVQHREQELNDFLKKNLIAITNQEDQI